MDTDMLNQYKQAYQRAMQLNPEGVPIRREKVAIVGSRAFPLLDHVKDFVRGLAPTVTVVSGNANGVDKTAQEAALANRLEVWIIPPDWRKGRGAGFARNHRVLDVSDRVVVFWDGVSKGTKHTLDQAIERGIPVTLFTPNIGVRRKDINR